MALDGASGQHCLTDAEKLGDGETERARFALQSAHRRIGDAFHWSQNQSGPVGEKHRGGLPIVDGAENPRTNRRH